MRISSQQINQQGIDALLEVNRQVAGTQRQLATGRRINDPGDDPVGAARVVKLKQELSLRTQYQSNIDSAEAQLARQESVLSQATDVLQRIRELSIQASNGVHTPEDRTFIAAEMKTRYEELVALVNSRGPSGEYLFGGYRSDRPPFEVTSAGVVYHGDEGRRLVQVDDGHRVAVTDSGRDIFMEVEARSPVFTVRPHPGNDPLAAASISRDAVVDRDAVADFFPDDLIIEFRPASESATGQANYTVRRSSDNRVVDGLQNVDFSPGAAIEAAGMSFRISGQPQVGDRFFVETTAKQDVLTTIQGAIDGFLNLDPATDPEEFEAMLGDTLAGLDNAAERIVGVQADLGARLNSLDSVRQLHTDLELKAEEVLSEVRDVDFAEAASRLAFQSFLLEAAQQSFVRVSRLSLFNAL